MDVRAFLASGKSILLTRSIEPGPPVCFVDSSFNPPNLAHLKLAQLCRATFPGCYVVFMLATGNADKPSVPEEDLETRVAMMDVLVKSEFADDERVGLALTTEARFIGKAAAAARLLPHARCVFAMGYDTLVRLARQEYYTEPIEAVLSSFFAQVEVLALTREEDYASKMPAIGSVETQLQLTGVLAEFEPRIHVVRSGIDTLNVSSSTARSSRSELERMTPPAVARYVENHHLYGL